MSFLEINGYAVPVSIATPRRKITKLGRRGRSFRGQFRDARRFIRRQWDVEAVMQGAADGDALRRLVQGEGHMVDMFSGLQASTGLQPVPGPNPVTVRSNAWGPFTRGVMTIAPGTTGIVLCYDAQLDDNAWTVLWFQLDALNTWRGYAKRSDGVCYREGVLNSSLGEPASNGFYPVAVGGVIELVKDSGVVVVVDDVVILPFRASTAMLAAWSQKASGKFGPSPVLRLTGDMVGAGETIFAIGDVTDVAVNDQPGETDGDWENAAKVVKFTLLEVDAGYYTEVTGTEQATPVPPGAPAFWFDGQDVDGLLNASLVQDVAVATWKDKGTRAQNATNAAGFQPLFKNTGESGRLGFASSLKFDGVNDKLITSVGALITEPFVVACVHRFENVASSNIVFDGVSALQRPRLQRNLTAYETTQGTIFTHPSVVAAVGRWDVSIVKFNNAGTVWRLNNAADAAGDTGVGQNGLEGFTLGGQHAVNLSMLNGHLVELLCWSDTSYGTFDDVMAYLEAKYGALPQD